jgi:hypothetical protein
MAYLAGRAVCAQPSLPVGYTMYTMAYREGRARARVYVCVMSVVAAAGAGR